MTSKEILLTMKLLRMASDIVGRRCSNDMDRELLDSIGFTDEEKAALALEYAQYNEGRADPEDIDMNNLVREFYRMPDFSWFSFMEHKLRQMRSQ